MTTSTTNSPEMPNAKKHYRKITYFLAGCVFSIITISLATILVQEKESSNGAFSSTDTAERNKSVANKTVDQPSMFNSYTNKDSIVSDKNVMEELSGAINVRGSQITLYENDIAIHELAVQLSVHFGISIVVDERIGSHTTQIMLSGASSKEAVAEAFKDYDVFLFLGEDNSGETLQKVWVYPRGSGQMLQPEKPALWLTTKELEDQLQDNEPELRANGIEALVERKGAGAVDAVVNVLNDDSATVRVRALSALVDAGISLPLGLIEQLITTDPSRSVRIQALSMLENITEIEDATLRSVAELALYDFDEDVRIFTEEILQTLGHSMEVLEREEEVVPPDANNS